MRSAVIGGFALTSLMALGQVTFTQVTNDADSGIDSSDTYTHAIDFSNGNANVNGVQFVGDFGTASGSIPNAGTRAYGNPTTGSTPPGVSGDVANVFNDFYYGGPDGGYVELTGLTPGQPYEFRLYDRPWDTSTGRTMILSFDVDSDGSIEYTAPQYDQNHPELAPVSLPSQAVSWVTSYTYTAGSNGTLKVIFGINTGATYHMYGLSNVEAGPDTTPPTIETSVPADDATGVYRGTAIMATFSEDVAFTGTGTIVVTDGSDSQTIQLDGVTPDDGDASIVDDVLTVTLDAPLANDNATYDVLISSDAIVDLASSPNAFAGTASGDWDFTTAAEDLTAPVLTTTDPADDATGISPTTVLTATFDDNIVAGTGDILINNVTDGGTAATIAVTDGSQVSISGNVLTITPSAPLPPDKEVAVQIAATAIENYSGVPYAGIADNATWSFNTVSTTTYAGAGGAWNIDTWNDAGNWNSGVPSGSLSAIIAAGEHVSTRDTVTPAYTGDLTLEAGATLQVGQTNEATAQNVFGGGTITMNAGSEITERFTSNSTHTQDLVLAGDATYAIGRSTSAHNKTRTWSGQISGAGLLTVHTSNGQRLYLTGDNSAWTGGLYSGGSESENKKATIEADATNSLGSGPVTIDDGITLRIDSADATTGTSSMLALAGRKASNEGKKLYMNQADEVGQLKVDGFQYPNGTYGKVGSGADNEMSWIDGNNLLTVSGAPVDNTAPMVTIDATAPGNALPNVYVDEPVSYTITFDEPHTPLLEISDLEITTPSAATIVSLTPVSELGDMTVLSYEVLVTGDEVGTLNLGIKSDAVISDLFGNALAVPVADNDTYNVVPWPDITDGLGIWKPWSNGGINTATGAAWAEGDKFVGAFVSSGTRDATDPDIATYHSFVSGAAATAGWGGVTWYCVGEAYNDPTRNTNAPTMNTSFVILLPNGAKLADSGADLSNGPDRFFNITEAGGEWNGNVASGSGRDFGDPGETNIEHGNSNRTDGAWWNVYNGSQTSQWHFYALSEELTLTSTSAPADPFDDWVTRDGASGVTFEGDLNGDGVADGLAFLLGADNPNVDAAGLLPAVEETGGSLKMIFSCLAAPGRAPAVLDLEWDGDLAGPWTSVVVPDVAGNTNPSAGTGAVAFTIVNGTPNGEGDAILDVEAVITDAAEAAGGKLFGRLKGAETAP